MQRRLGFVAPGGVKLEKISIGVILHNLLVSMSIAKSFFSNSKED
jgi:hypothetical protein